MKALRHILLLAVVLTAASCNDFLDIQPTGKVIPQTGAEFRALLVEAYNEVPENRGLISFRSDELLINEGNSESYDRESYLDIWTWNDDNGQETTASFEWRVYYHVIYIANYILEHQHEMTQVTDIDRRQMVGEAYMLRAYMHFTLANIYGEAYTHCDPRTAKAVPLKLDTNIDKMLKRSTLESIYTSVLDDIKEAEKYLNKESWETGFNYRFNVVSADALRARVMLYMGNWKEAYKAAVRVIEKHGELEDLNSSSTLPTHYQSVESIVSLERVMTDSYSKVGSVSADLLALYASTDRRRTKYYKFVTAGNANCIKMGTAPFRSTFRSSEFYLIAAEAALEDNDPDNAVLYLTRLMEKRYFRLPTLPEETDALRQFIYDERFRELAFEGHRWFDLRRTTQPELKKSFGLDKEGEPIVYTLQPNDARYTVRIPAAVISANPGLAD